MKIAIIYGLALKLFKLTCIKDMLERKKIVIKYTRLKQLNFSLKHLVNY